MSGTIALVLRLLMAGSLYGFLGWALIILLREVRKQGESLANRRVPRISLSVQMGRGSSSPKHFSQPEVVLGRDPGCDVPLMDETVSTRHAQLSFHHGQWWLEDLGSTNGTFLNDIGVNMPTVITSGDEIQCGNLKLAVNLESDVFISPTQRLEKHNG